MCRSIKDLRHQPLEPTPAEIEAAARQFIRKVSGYRAPPRRYAAVYDAAIAAVATTTNELLAEIWANAPRRSDVPEAVDARV